MGWLDRYLCPLAQTAETFGASAVILVCTGLFAGGLLGGTVLRFLKRRFAHGSGTMMPFWVASVFFACGIYLVAMAIDPLLKAFLDRPATIPPEFWDRIGFFEYKLLGQWAWPILPLSHHPGVGIAVHLATWIALVFLIQGVLVWLYRDVRIHWESPESSLPWFYHWAGSRTARRADQRFKPWLRRLLFLLGPMHLLCGYLVAVENEARFSRADLQCEAGGMTMPSELPDGVDASAIPGIGEASALLAERLDAGAIAGAPFPGAWVLAGFLLFALSMHLLLEGKEPLAKKEEEKKKEEELPPIIEDPLRRLGDAVQALSPGAFLESLEERPAKEAELVEFSAGTSPLVREAFTSLTGSEKPWSHQKELLDHLAEVWQMKGAAGLGAAPTLREELAPEPVRRGEASTDHALVLAPEGCGRTTVTCVAALFVQLDRGATTLVVTRDRDTASAWAARLGEGLSKSSARWNVEVCIAGVDLSPALLAGRTPAIVVAGLEELEADVLGNPRTDSFFASLGLIVAEDVDAFTGVAEMHLHMVMRRVWALLDTLHDAPYPVALVAVAGPSASGMDAWARHVLAAPMRLFDGDGAPRLVRAVVRRRDLADARGEDLPLALLAEACDRAAIPWHLRHAGDGLRDVSRPETELGHLRRHHVIDPLDAEVVLLEGTYPDVRRESERLAHAGRRSTRKSVVLVLAPPADEEMVLHEEAADALHRELVDSLPRAVGLSEPDIVRQRHFDRALAREQDARALRERFGAELTDDILARLRANGRIKERHVWYFDPRADDAATRLLVRAAGEAALGEPIVDSCVGEASDRMRVVDKGTSEVLREVDRAIATALFPPGAVFLHERGRYRALESKDRSPVFECEQAVENVRTTAERALSIEPEERAWTERQLGGAAIRVATGRARVEERVHGVRSYSPGPRLVEQRRYTAPVMSSYTTHACLVSMRGEGLPEVGLAVLIPLAAAVRMVLPCYVRGAHDLVDVGFIDADGDAALVLFDRTAGASGFTHFLSERGLAELFALARLALERLVGPERTRLHRIHDTSFNDLDPSRWNTRGALEWLDRVLDREAREDAEEPLEERGRRVVFAHGEGKGDLGRLWISSTGRTDDLVWTRHRFRTAHAIAKDRPGGEIPAGPVFFDVAVERRTIGHAVRRATAAGASSHPTETKSSESWIKQHSAALATASIDLVAVVDRLRDLAGEHYVDVALALVAAIPTSPEALPPAERAPLAVLARRRADRDAKVLLAWAMLPTEVKPAVRLVEGGAVLQITRAGKTEVVDLSGSAIRTIDGDAGAVLSLSWGEAPKQATSSPQVGVDEEGSPAE
jgi:hypothetical protein